MHSEITQCIFFGGDICSCFVSKILNHCQATGSFFLYVTAKYISWEVGILVLLLCYAWEGDIGSANIIFFFSLTPLPDVMNQSRRSLFFSCIYSFF